ncbi:protein of unassigned function [Methylobacterium oryzae CBMB20]|uniref:Protein of unassigned function n=1 Tax=Methylobacterium oryzae CBMB20 TaxID=693986 RepID=A0A089NKW1_9HYPH|nr:protein of unassigned function [Methylobacterium oryzae CBMB20]
MGQAQGAAKPICGDRPGAGQDGAPEGWSSGPSAVTAALIER